MQVHATIQDSKQMDEPKCKDVKNQSGLKTFYFNTVFFQNGRINNGNGRVDGIICRILSKKNGVY